MNEGRKNVKDIIEGLGIRLTPQRKAILELLINQAGQHLRAEDIHGQLKSQEQPVGLATVYRTLDLLEEEGLVASRTLGSDSAYYEYIGSQKNVHHHLICKQCGKVIETSGLLISNWQEKLAAEDFVPTDCCIKIEGYCQECS